MGLVQYRMGRTRRVTIGPLGAVTPDQARARARLLLGQVASGVDPAGAADRDKAALTLGEVIVRFLSEHVDTKLKPRTAEEYRRGLEQHIPVSLRRRPIAEVQRADIVKPPFSGPLLCAFI